MGEGYVPARGDVVWLDFDPQSGHEQMGKRPAIVLSPSLYNSKAGLAVFCPVTSRIKGYPFEVALPDGLPVQGVVLSDQVKSLDWHGRNAEFICTLSGQVMSLVLAKLRTLLD